MENYYFSKFSEFMPELLMSEAILNKNYGVYRAFLKFSVNLGEIKNLCRKVLCVWARNQLSLKLWKGLYLHVKISIENWLIIIQQF